jgi:8-oxo-dGTP diphosphatase
VRERVEVVAAVISQGDDEAVLAPITSDRPILISQRLANKHLAGFWEFPGGRVEAGESPRMALARELSEELGIEVLHALPWCSLTHSYETKTIRLMIFRVTRWLGEPMGKEGQAIEWVPWETLPSRRMPPADQALLKVFGRAPFYQRLDPSRPAADIRHQAGRTPVVMDLHGPDPSCNYPSLLAWHNRGDNTQASGFDELVHEFWPLMRKRGHECLLIGEPEVAEYWGADGVELSESRLMSMSERPRTVKWVGAKCADLKAIQKATQLGLDFAVIDGPECPHCSEAVFNEMLDASGLPIFVRGTPTTDQLILYRNRGAYGVADDQVEWLR